jgi:hypothetical protein
MKRATWVATRMIEIRVLDRRVKLTVAGPKAVGD